MSILNKSILGTALLTGTLFANDLTPQQLKAACETSPGNTVVVSGPIKITGFSSRVNVTTGCRLVFGATAKFESDSVNMGFAGPLVFQGGTSAATVFVKTLFEAPSMTVDLAGGSNEVNVAESTLRATTGNLSVNIGPNSVWNVTSRFAGRVHAMQAAGSISVSGAGKFDGSLSCASVLGASGIAISGSGNEMTLGFGNSNLIATNGAISITSPGIQATLNYPQGQMRAGTGITISFSGNEGQASLQQVVANAGTGSFTVQTALGGARPAKSIVTESNIVAGGSVSVLASVGGQSGEAARESSRVTATGDLVVRSGALGTTNVKVNPLLRSNSLVGAYTGPSGSCTAEGNTVISPARALCLP